MTQVGRTSAPLLLLRLLGRAAVAWARDGASSMGAAIAFYALISLPPAVAVTLEMASFTLDPGAVREALLSQIHMLWGADAAVTTTAIAHYAVRSHSSQWFTWVALAISLVTASTVFVEMRRSLDFIWGKGNAGAVAGVVISRLVAFGVLAILGVALWASVLASTLLQAADTRYLEQFGVTAIVLGMAGNAVTGILILVLLALLYKLLPAHRVAWVDAWSGASVVTCLYLVGKEGIAYYLGTQTIAPTFGGGIAGALVVLLLWFYYSAQIFLYGAELSHEVSLERESAGQSGARHGGGNPVPP